MARLFQVTRMDGQKVYGNPLQVVRVYPAGQPNTTAILFTAGPSGEGGPGITREPGRQEFSILVVQELLDEVARRINEALGS